MMFFLPFLISEPLVEPTDINYLTSETTTTTLTFTFTEIPCGSRRGNTQYQYEIKDFATKMVEHGASFNVSVSINMLTVIIWNLRSGINYSFRVRGINDNGALHGPYSGSYTAMTKGEYMLKTKSHPQMASSVDTM